MARFREGFEVKNEMQDGGKIRPDDSYKQNGGKSSKTQQQEILADVNEIGFDNEYEDVEEVDVYEDIEQETYEGEKEVYEDDRNDTQDEYDTLNSQVESELGQYWDDDITQEDLIQYFTNKISEIYGEKLKKCNIVMDSYVEGFFENNVTEVIVDKSEAIETYRNLVQATNETIADISERMAKSKNEKNVEDKGKENKLQTLSDQVVQRIMTGYQNVSIGGELQANAYIASEAKKLGVEKNELHAFIVGKGKERINSPDKVLHYHRTSMQSFEKIMQTGFLLNRKNMQLNGIDTSNLSGSSSANVQFTRDMYNTDGELQMSGFGRDNVGANSTDVVFVMGPELINEETYNCFMPYPTVEKADIQRCCAAILAKDPNIQMQIESILKEKNLPIRTMLQEEFDREAVLEELGRTDVSKQVEETGAILHSVNGKPIREETGAILKSVNGRDILSSAIEATEETTRTSTINEQVHNIRSIQRDRTQQQDKMNNEIDR